MIYLFVTQTSKHDLIPLYKTYTFLSKVEDHSALSDAGPEMQDLWMMHSLLRQPECDISWSAQLGIQTSLSCHIQAECTMVNYNPKHCNSSPIIKRGKRETHSSHLSTAMISSYQSEESRFPFLPILYVP